MPNAKLGEIVITPPSTGKPYYEGYVKGHPSTKTRASSERDLVRKLSESKPIRQHVSKIVDKAIKDAFKGFR